MDSIPLRRCTACENDLPATIEFFHRNKMGKDGLRPECKECRSQKKEKPLKGGRPPGSQSPICTKCGEDDLTKFYYIKGKRKSICKRCDLENKAQQRKNKPEQYNARMKRWREANPDYQRNWTYGLSEQEYWQMFVTQNNACKICKRPFTEKRKPHIDHDHQTNKIRGLLCPRCNHGLGCFEDDTDLLREAVRYLG